MLGFQTPWNPFYLVRQAPLIPQRHTAKDTEFLTQIWHSDTIRCTKIEGKICEKLSVFNLFWIERCPPKAEVRGSNPLGCAITLSIYSDRYKFLISVCSQETSFLTQIWHSKRSNQFMHPLILIWKIGVFRLSNCCLKFDRKFEYFFLCSKRNSSNFACISSYLLFWCQYRTHTPLLRISVLPKLFILLTRMILYLVEYKSLKLSAIYWT